MKPCFSKECGVFPFETINKGEEIMEGKLVTRIIIIFLGFIKSVRKLQAFKPGDEWPPGAKRRPFRHNLARS
jgi:hypothetical protein